MFYVLWHINNSILNTNNPISSSPLYLAQPQSQPPLKIRVTWLSSKQLNRNGHDMCHFQIWLLNTHPTCSSTLFDLLVTGVEDDRSARRNDTGFLNHHLKNHTGTMNISLVDYVNNFHCFKPLKLRNLPVRATGITLTNKEVIRVRRLCQYCFYIFLLAILPPCSDFRLLASPWWSTEAHWDNRLGV